MSSSAGYYSKHVATLQDLFGTSDVQVFDAELKVGDRRFPIRDDVIILEAPAGGDPAEEAAAEGVRFTFGQQWRSFDRILPEHEREWGQYFDLFSESELRGIRACDLGCGIGRWSYFLAERCREIVLVDFSDAIFVARRNLRNSDRCLFFQADIRSLPFRRDFADLIFSLGVLHHLPVDALAQVRRLARFAPCLLIYLYYALDNRPWHFRAIFRGADAARRLLSRVRGTRLRSAISWGLTAGVYAPFLLAGRVLAPLGLSSRVPLYEYYGGMSWSRIRQDAYDRFFTPVEHRYTRRQISTLYDTFSKVGISEGLPYWHFRCDR
ncbi:MAG: class I SAM-dependent methyltransferase [Acidobacteriota bacterium]|nr:class I SAM-dependent methyltransferase [Acidobacteriota bacterium]